MKNFKVEIPLPIVSDALFDKDVKKTPVEETPSSPEYQEINDELKLMSDDVINQTKYGELKKKSKLP